MSPVPFSSTQVLKGERDTKRAKTHPQANESIRLFPIAADKIQNMIDRLVYT
jgi:hypothetical protein